MMTSEQPAEILLVEDDPNDLELTLHALRRPDFAGQIQVVRDGAEALDFMFCTGPYAGRDPRHRPRLVLLDLRLPKMTGLEVLQHLKSDERTRTMPVVVLSSSREDRDIAESYRLGVNSYVVKPVDFEQFRRTVQQVGLYWTTLNQAPHT
jgi:two-component system response regulator